MKHKIFLNKVKEAYCLVRSYKLSTGQYRGQFAGSTIIANFPRRDFIQNAKVVDCMFLSSLFNEVYIRNCRFLSQVSCLYSLSTNKASVSAGKFVEQAYHMHNLQLFSWAQSHFYGIVSFLNWLFRGLRKNSDQSFTMFVEIEVSLLLNFSAETWMM